MEKLKKGISKARLRILANNLIHSLIIIAPVVIILTAIFTLVDQFASSKHNLSFLYLPALAGVFLFLVYRTTKGVGRLEVALKIDRRADLADRTSSALEFNEMENPTLFMNAAMDDAAAQIEKVDFKKAFPLWPRGLTPSIIASLLVVPLLLLVLYVDFGEKYLPDRTSLDRDLPIEQIPSDVPDAPDLAKAVIPPRLAPLIEPVKSYINAWKSNLRKMRKELQRREKELAAEVPKAIFSEKGDGNAGEAGGIMGLKTAITDGKVHISDLKTMGVYNGSEYDDAFAALDEIAFEDEPDIEAVAALAQVMTDTADRKASSGKTLGLAASLNVQTGMDADEVIGFKGATKGAMQESFNEFLRNYGAHLTNIASTKAQIAEEAKASGKIVRTAMSSAPPPPDAKLKMMKLNDKDHRNVHLSPTAIQENENKLGAGMAPGDQGSSKAGRGGGTAEGVIKTAKVEKSPQNYVEMEGAIGEGKSAIKILEDLDSLNMEDFSKAEYRQLYVDYTQNASMILDSEQIPIEIKSYIRDYFMAITPEKVGPKTDGGGNEAPKP